MGIWFGGRLDSARLTVGLDNLKGLFQPKRFCDSMKYFPGSFESYITRVFYFSSRL